MVVQNSDSRTSFFHAVTGDPIDITHGKALLNLCVSVSDSGLLTGWLTHTATLGFMRETETSLVPSIIRSSSSQSLSSGLD
jgi:hypothetical protein